MCCLWQICLTYMPGSVIFRNKDEFFDKKNGIFADEQVCITAYFNKLYGAFFRLHSL